MIRLGTILSAVLGCAMLAAPLAAAAQSNAAGAPPSAPAAATPIAAPPGSPPVVAPVPAPAVAPMPAPAVEPTRANYSFRDASIEEVFDMLAQQGKLNIIVSRGVTGKVTLNLYDVTARQALYSIARASGYWVEVRDGAYVILGKGTGLDHTINDTVVETLKVQYSEPKQVAEILAKYVSGYGKITPLEGRKLVVVEDLPGFVQRIKTLLAQIDIPPRQIMIEAKILEIGLDESERFGIDWAKIWSSRSYPGSFGTSGLAFGDAAAPSQGFFFSLMGDKITAYLSALATKGRVRTLSTPKLLAMENQEAKAVIGDSTGYKVTTTINLVTTETVLFLESGVILRVTPSIDQKGRILLKVQPEVSSATLNAGIPSKKSTQVTTELLAEDGQSVFIAGLIKSRSSLDRNAVPVLGDLPVVGNLFSNYSEAVTATETVVIITPHIINDPKEADRFTQDRVRQTERTSAQIREHEMYLGDRVPRLPREEPAPVEKR